MKFTEMENRGGEQEGGGWELVCNGGRVPVRDDEKVLEMDGSSNSLLKNDDAGKICYVIITICKK